ncbi:MAG: hypothetical protein LBU26_03620 [Synergistaceae bacterium]|jgi:hypothetical protein|nr:hypothetical protein [Synergistaceae bacterium]
MAYSEPMTARLRSVEESLKDIYAANSSVILVRAVNRLGDLREGKITPVDMDAQFIGDMYRLLGRRRAFMDKIPAAHVCAGIAGGLAFLLLTLAPANIVAVCTFASYIISAVLWGVYYFVFSEIRPDGQTSFGREWNGVAAGILSFGYGWARLRFGNGTRSYDTALFDLTAHFRPIFGISLGITISYGASNYILRGYMKEMINACETYCSGFGR